MSNFITVEWLNNHLTNEDVIILDARYSPTDAHYGSTEYEKEHILNAQHVDIALLTDEQSDYGGAKPLPYPDKLAKFFASLGINEHSTVVIYDDYIRPESARVWWLRKFIGHKKVFILNGGFTEWKEGGFPVTKKVPVIQTSSYTPTPEWQIALKKRDVEEIMSQGQAYLIDARNENVYAADEPGNPGHITGASNYFWKRHLNGKKLKALAEIKEELHAYALSDPIVHYCGSGISACFNYLLFDELGYNNIKLYPGSFSDWSASSD